LVAAAVVLVVASAALAPSADGARQDDAASPGASTPVTIVGEAGMPEWTFTVLAYQDPYAGSVRSPDEQQPGVRYIGAEVVFDNASNQPLNVVSTDIRVRTSDGTEYPAGGMTGAEPKLNSQNVPPGEQARGWVWFVVPEDVEIVEIYFAAPRPRLQVPLANL
jgi:hypothetical protein